MENTLVSSFQQLVEMLKLNNQYSDSELNLNEVIEKRQRLSSTGSTMSPKSTSSSMCQESSMQKSPNSSTDSINFPTPRLTKKFLRSEQVKINDSQFQNSSKQSQKNKPLFCQFCKNNGEPAQIYTSHLFRDFKGKVCCPILRQHQCPLCGESGDKAHTFTYCRKYKNSKLNSLIKN